jgi:uncharacterized membrane protein YfcA
MTFLVLFLASLWAGVQNALAGGGSFITLPSLMLTGMDARAANITSTIALFPAQLATGWTGRKHVQGAAGLSFRALVIISLIGGALGAVLLLVTPPSFFGPKREGPPRLNRAGAGVAQFFISVYGGYFGGGIGFLMLAALTAAGVVMRSAGATKNVLAGVMNASAVLIFVFSPEVRWFAAGVSCAGAILGGVAGGLMLQKVNERALRVMVVLIGVALTVGLFLRAP